MISADTLILLLQVCSVALIPGAFELVKRKMDTSEKLREKKYQADLERQKTQSSKLDRIIEAVDLNNQSSKATLRYMLQRHHAEYKLQGFVTSKQLDEFNRDFEIYKAQGGNGTAERWCAEVNDLPIDDSRSPKNFYLELYKKQHTSED